VLKAKAIEDKPLICSGEDFLEGREGVSDGGGVVGEEYDGLLEAMRSLTKSGRSLTKTRKRNGARRELWGTPQKMSMRAPLGRMLT